MAYMFSLNSKTKSILSVLICISLLEQMELSMELSMDAPLYKRLHIFVDVMVMMLNDIKKIYISKYLANREFAYI